MTARPLALRAVAPGARSAAGMIRHRRALETAPTRERRLHRPVRPVSAVLDRHSVTAAVIVSAAALVIPRFAVIITNVASAADRRRP